MSPTLLKSLKVAGDESISYSFFCYLKQSYYFKTVFLCPLTRLYYDDPETAVVGLLNMAKKKKMMLCDLLVCDFCVFRVYPPLVLGALLPPSKGVKMPKYIYDL